MPQQPLCPECRSAVQPSWDWCMACGFDPEGLKPSGWVAPYLMGGTAGPMTAAAGSGSTATLVAPAARATVVGDARPQQITDPDWVQAPPRRRLSALATAGVVAAILVAVAGLVFVILMVLHQPVGSTQADALATFSGRVATSTG